MLGNGKLSLGENVIMGMNRWKWLKAGVKVLNFLFGGGRKKAPKLSVKNGYNRHSKYYESHHDGDLL